MAQPIVISILANASQASRTFDQTSSGAKAMASRVSDAGRKVAAGLAVGAAAATAFAASTITSASDAQQSLGATETVFGKYADTVIRRSKEAATALGLSANEYRELSNVTGALLQGAGVPLEKTTKLTETLNERAADMAATFGGTTREAVDAISSLLKGAGDPVERYGVSIRQADVNARLLANGQDKLTGSAMKQAEMTARLDLLMGKTAKTQGAFGRESGTLANQQQKLGAQVENLKAKIGTALLPVLTKIATFINTKVIPAATKFGEALGARLTPIIERVKTGFGDLMTRLTPVTDWLRKNPEAVKGAAIALGIAAGAALALAAAMAILAVASSPVTLTVLAIAALGAGLALAYKRSESFRNIVDKVGVFIRTKLLPALVDFGGYLKDTVLPAIVETAKRIGEKLQPILRALGTFITGSLVPFLGQVAQKFRDWWPTIKEIGTAIARLVGRLLVFVAGIAGKVIPVLIRFAGYVVRNLIPVIKRIAEIAIDVFGRVREVVTRVIGWFRDWVPPVFERVAKGVRRYVQVWGTVFRTVRDVIKGIVERIRTIIEGVIETIRKVIDKIQAAIEKAKELAGIDTTGSTAIPDAVRENYIRSGAPRPTYQGGGRPAPEPRAAGTGNGRIVGDTIINIDKMMPHDYGDFTRQTDRQRRRAASDMVRRQ